MTKPIKLIHTGDLHIGIQNYGRLDSTTGLHTRLKDFLDTFDNLVSYAVDTGQNAVLISGDIFKNREPDVTQQREFAKRIKTLSDARINVYIIIGNHDLHNAAYKATSVEIYDVLDMPYVYVRKRPSVDVIDTPNGPFQVVALPYISPSNMNIEGTTIEEISLSIRKGIEGLIDGLVKQLDNTLPTVLMSHFSIIGAVPGSEKSILLGREVTLPVSFFARPEFDYVAMGHIHKYQTLYLDPPVVYCGSMDRVDFNEEKEDKGFVEVSLSKGNAEYEFIKLPTRPFKTIYVTADDGDDPFEKTLSEIKKYDLKDAIVKLKVKLPAQNLPMLKEKELLKILRENTFYVAGIEKNIVSDLSHLRHPGITERMSVSQAIREYINKKDEYTALESELLKVNDDLIQELKGEGSI